MKYITLAHVGLMKHTSNVSSASKIFNRMNSAAPIFFLSFSLEGRSGRLFLRLFCFCLEDKQMNLSFSCALDSNADSNMIIAFK